MARSAHDGGVIEIVGDDRRPDGPRPGSERPRIGRIAVSVAAIALAALGLSRLTDDPARPPPAPSPGIFSLDSIDAADSPNSRDTTYPVLDREWGQTALWVQQAGIVAFDLDTGESRVWLPNDRQISNRAWNGVSIVDGVAYVTFGTTGLARIDTSGPIVVHENEPEGPATRVTGEYLVSHASDEGATTLEHLPTGDEVELAAGSRFAVIGGSVLVERDGSIFLREPQAPERFWADGELVARGRDAAIHRSCDPDGRCRSYAGWATDPEATPLDDDAVRELIGALALFPSVSAAVPELASPDGRFAVVARRESDSVQDALTDLTDGSSVDIGQSPRGWSAGGAAYATEVSPAVAIVSMVDGAAARLPLLTSAGARWQSEIVFVATDEPAAVP